MFYFLFHVHPNHWKTLRLNHLNWPVRICRHMMQCHFFYWTKNGEEIKLVFYINVKLKSTFIKPVDCRLNCSLCWLLTRMGFKIGKICTLWRLKVEVFFPLQRTEWQTNLTVTITLCRGSDSKEYRRNKTICRLNLYPFFTQMMNLFPHPDFAVILEHMLFHPRIRPDANSSGAAGNGNWDTGCHFKHTLR